VTHLFSQLAMTIRIVLLLLLSFASAASVSPSLGAAASFAVLASTTATTTGVVTVNGDVGTSPGTSITGFAGATTHSQDAASIAAQASILALTAVAFSLLFVCILLTHFSGTQRIKVHRH
jgi:hypothetical protein